LEIVPKAVSNSVCETTFSEYDVDETGECPFLTEASALDSPMIEDQRRPTKYKVEVTTLDAFFSERGFPHSPVVIKIDVEGFEAHVLEGSPSLIESTRPWLSIDIHKDPFGDGTTEAKVRALLGCHGYEFQNMAHVLLAAPAPSMA
jgi:FkbM family methyltransferase